MISAIVVRSVLGSFGTIVTRRACSGLVLEFFPLMRRPRFVTNRSCCPVIIVLIIRVSGLFVGFVLRFAGVISPLTDTAPSKRSAPGAMSQ